MKKLIPPLAGADYFVQHKEALPCIIRNGLKDTITVNGILFYRAMPGNKDLTETDIANLINYIHKKWYPELPFAGPSKIKVQLEKCNE